MLQAGRLWVRVPMRWIFFYLPNPSGHTTAQGSTQPPTEMSTEIFLGVKGGRCMGLTTLSPSVSQMFRQNVGASTSQNPMGLHGLLQGQLYLTLPYKMAVFPKLTVQN
jgi:hypothetical protein